MLSRKRTLTENAFGAVPHNLIFHELKRNHFPPIITDYFKDLYNNTKSKVITSSFQTNVFSFKRGVFQGDPMSPILFILTFNPVLQMLLDQDEKGYNLNGERYITLPYADDFCLLSTNKRTHQKIINIINQNILSMGMRLKPSKC